MFRIFRMQSGKDVLEDSPLYNLLSRKPHAFRQGMNANIYEGTDDIKPGVKLLPEIWKKVMRGNPHETTDPKGLRHEVGNVSVPQSGKRNGPQAYPDCMQTGMHARGALIPPERQRPGLERPQDSVMGSRKTVRTVRDEGESGAKVRTPDASARGVCQTTVQFK